MTLGVLLCSLLIPAAENLPPVEGSEGDLFSEEEIPLPERGESVDCLGS